MKKIDTPIWEAAIKTGLSQLQIWILIKNRLIYSSKAGEEAKICYSSLRLWMSNNRVLSNQLQLDVDIRDREQMLTTYIEKVKKRRRNGTL